MEKSEQASVRRFIESHARRLDFTLNIHSFSCLRDAKEATKKVLLELFANDGSRMRTRDT